MKPAHVTIASVRNIRVVLLVGAFAAVLTTVACTAKAKPAVHSTQSQSSSVTSHPAAAKDKAAAAVEKAAPAAEIKKVSAAAKLSPTQLLSYRSRDYGISFLYPWQYTMRGARAIATGDESLQPVSDGFDGQITLVRVDVPKGFYPDTDFQSGYFILGLNQDLDQQECESTLGAAKDGKIASAVVNGAEFHWIESDSGGRGQSAKVRRYVSFTAGACYEIELGVKSNNADGLAREIDPDQVLRRLDAILQTVKIQPSAAEVVVADKTSN